MTESSTERLDCLELTSLELAERLRAMTDDTAIRLVNVAKNADVRDGLAAGLNSSVSINVSGTVGDFLFLLGNQASVEVSGGAGDSVGHSLVSGNIRIAGNAGHFAGIFASGGFLAVLGQARDYCASGLNGGVVLVRSKVGDCAAWSMRDGVLVLGNGCGKLLGSHMAGGVIYVRGEVASTAQHVHTTRMKDADTMRLSLLLARAGVRADVAEFRAVRPRAMQS